MFTVMLVEDEEIERKALEIIINKYFSKELLVVYQTNNGKSAVEYIEHNSLDLIIMDIEMPIMDGIMAAKEIRKFNTDVKIIILTAYPEFDYAKGAIEAKVLHFLLKPVNTSEFETVMQKLIKTLSLEINRKDTADMELRSIIDLASDDNEVSQMFLLLHNNQLEAAFAIYQTVMEKAQSKELSQAIFCKIGISFLNKIIACINNKMKAGSEVIEDFNYDSDDSEHFMEVCYEYLSNICFLLSHNKLKSNANLRIVNKVIQYINDNLKKELNLEDLAHLVHLNSDYFGKIFKQIVGINFKEYVIKIRIENAKVLIDSGEYSIKEISYLVGYSDPNYFSRSFKKIVGISAVEYRNKL